MLKQTQDQLNDQETHATIGRYLADLLAAGYSTEVHHNAIAGDYRVSVCSITNPTECVVRGRTLVMALARACVEVL